MRIIKTSGADARDGQRPTLHGSSAKREHETARGNLRRMNERPGQHQPRRTGR